MLSLRHSIGKASPLESLARNAKSIPYFCCYAALPALKPVPQSGIGCARILNQAPGVESNWQVVHRDSGRFTAGQVLRGSLTRAGTVCSEGTDSAIRTRTPRR